MELRPGLQIGVGVLMILWIVAAANGGSLPVEDTLEAEHNWPTQGLGSDLPAPENGTIRSSYSNKSSFSATIKGIKQADFDAYVEECQKSGYTIDAESSDRQYEAYNEADQKLTVSYWSSNKELNVRVEKAVEMGEFHWPTGEIVSGVPVPEAEKSNLEKLSNNSLSMYVGDLTKEEFVSYVNQCMEAGFEGSYYDDNDTFYGKKDGKSLRLEFIRGRIMYIDVYVSSK